MPKKKNDETILLCEVDGYQIRITPTNNVFVRAPDGTRGFPWTDRFNNLNFNGALKAVPLAVEAKVRVAVANREKARKLRRQDELCEPPDSLTSEF